MKRSSSNTNGKSTRREAVEAAWLAVVRAYQLCARRYEQLLLRFGLTTPQFDALVAIESLGDEALPKNVAARMLVTRGNVSGILDRLQAREVIELRPHPGDGRARVAVLTPAGRGRLDRARDAARCFIERQMAPFDDVEIEHTRRSMERMRQHLQTLDPDEMVDEIVRASRTEENA